MVCNGIVLNNQEDEEITDEMLDQIAESEARAAYQGSHGRRGE